MTPQGQQTFIEEIADWLEQTVCGNETLTITHVQIRDHHKWIITLTATEGIFRGEDTTAAAAVELFEKEVEIGNPSL